MVEGNVPGRTAPTAAHFFASLSVPSRTSTRAICRAIARRGTGHHLLDLVTAVTEHATTEAEVVATIITW